MDIHHANYLLSLEKYIIIDNKQQSNLEILISGAVSIRWKLVSPADVDQEFLIDIKESPKKALAMSLHHQDDISKEGIVRIDYHTRHKNPAHILPTVPPSFIPFAGIYLDQYPAHIHYVVDGYPALAWAIPLNNDPFPIKDLQNTPDVAKAINAFCKLINVKTVLFLNTQTSLI